MNNLIKFKSHITHYLKIHFSLTSTGKKVDLCPKPFSTPTIHCRMFLKASQTRTQLRGGNIGFFNWRIVPSSSDLTPQNQADPTTKHKLDTIKTSPISQKVQTPNPSPIAA